MLTRTLSKTQVYKTDRGGETGGGLSRLENAVKRPDVCRQRRPYAQQTGRNMRNALICWEIIRGAAGVKVETGSRKTPISAEHNGGGCEKKVGS